MRQDHRVEGELIVSHKSHGKFLKRQDAQCKIGKQVGHDVVICKSKFQNDGTVGNVTTNEEEEYHFLWKVVFPKNLFFYDL